MSRTSNVPASANMRTALLLVVGGILVWALSDIVLLVFAAVLLAVALRGMANGLSRLTGMPVTLSLAVVSLLGVVFVGVFIWLFGMRFATEGQQLVNDISRWIGELQQRYGQSTWFQRIEHAASAQGSIAPLAPKLLTVTFGTVGAFFLLIVIALYVAVSPHPYMRGIVLLMPPARRRRTREMLDLLGHVLRYWMLGQLIDMAVVGLLSTLGLIVLGVPLALALGVLAGVLTFVPYVGAIIAGIPAVIVASTLGPASILWVVLLYLGCHSVEGYLVAPLVTRRTVRLAPAVTVLSMTVLGELYGFIGVLIATPLTAAVITLVKELYIRDYLGTPPEAEGRELDA